MGLGHRHAQRKDHMKALKKTTIYKPREEVSIDTNLADNLVSDF